MIGEAQVREVLNGIVDPCSTAAGVPAGLCDMGLVHAVEVDPGGRVAVTLGVTEPGCFMIGSFAMEARARLLALADVTAVELQLDEGFDWTEDSMAPAYRARLDEHRRSTHPGSRPLAVRLGPTRSGRSGAA